MQQRNNISILGIETSCDETAIAVLRGSKSKKLHFELLSNIIASQVKIHQKYGGVYPSLARREHEKNLVPVLKKALGEAEMLKKSKWQNPRPLRLAKQGGRANVKPSTKAEFDAGLVPPSPALYQKGGAGAGPNQNGKIQALEKILERHEKLHNNLKKFLLAHQKPEIDIIAVTIGPGLEPCLWAGVNFAKALACFWNLPIIPVDHIEAHIFANFIGPNSKFKIKNLFPTIAPVVSGGHTQLVLMKDFGKYKIIGETRDDAAGECYDKTARILGLLYPGGPAIAVEAAKLKVKSEKHAPHRNKVSGAGLKVKLPRPMLYSKDYDFSFSGLKTAVLYDFKKRNHKIRKSKKYIQTMSSEIQQAVNDVLIKKTIKAAKDFRAKTIILSGGVAANNELRKQLQSAISNQQLTINFLVPPKNLCTDNAAMIAVTAYFHFKKCSKCEVEHFKNWEKIKAKANLRLT